MISIITLCCCLMSQPALSPLDIQIMETENQMDKIDLASIMATDQTWLNAAAVERHRLNDMKVELLKQKFQQNH